MRRIIPFEKKENVDELLSQALAVPGAGGLEPDPAIRNAAVARMSARERNGVNVLRFLRFPVRLPVYQMAFAMGIVLFAVLGISPVAAPIPRRQGLPNRQLRLWIRAGPILPEFRFQIRSRNALLSIFFPLPVL